MGNSGFGHGMIKCAVRVVNNLQRNEIIAPDSGLPQPGFTLVIFTFRLLIIETLAL